MTKYLFELSSNAIFGGKIAFFYVDGPIFKLCDDE
jgi:hypothetical protein